MMLRLLSALVVLSMSAGCQTLTDENSGFRFAEAALTPGNPVQYAREKTFHLELMPYVPSATTDRAWALDANNRYPIAGAYEVFKRLRKGGASFARGPLLADVTVLNVDPGKVEEVMYLKTDPSDLEVDRFLRYIQPISKGARSVTFRVELTGGTVNSIVFPYAAFLKGEPMIEVTALNFSLGGPFAVENMLIASMGHRVWPNPKPNPKPGDVEQLNAANVGMLIPLQVEGMQRISFSNTLFFREGERS